MLDAAGKVALRESIPLRLNEGRNWIKQSLHVASPKPWWPNGLGAANVYKVRLTLAEQGKVLDRLEFDYGIRTI